MASSNPKPKDLQSEKGKAPTQGEKEVKNRNHFNVLNVEEGKIIMNEVTLVEDISEPHDTLADNNIPSSSPREEQLETTIEDSPTPGRYCVTPRF